MIARDWAGEPAFIICGGPSVALHDLDVLRGRRVIVINASYKVAPWADVLFFGDAQCWSWYRDKGMGEFAGRIITVHEKVPSKRYADTKVEQYLKIKPPKLSRDPSQLTMARTSTTGAINLAAHLGSPLIVTIGLDGKASDGKTHHHDAHPNRRFLPPSQRLREKVSAWEKHRKELCAIVPSLREWGVDVLNASPGSACDAFPIVTLDEALQRADLKRAA